MSPSVVGTRLGSLVGTRPGANGNPNFPTAAAQIATLTGITPTSVWACTETSGPLVDGVGGLNLAAVGTPTYQYQVDDRRGIFYDAAADGHAADVLSLGLASGLYVWAGRVMPALGSTGGIMGRVAVAARPSVVSYSTTGVNYPTTLIRDDTVGQLIMSDTAVDLMTPKWAHLLTLQIDRANAIARVRISRPGKLVSEYSGSIAGFTTFAGAASFGFGADALGVLVGGNSVSWAMAAVGAQCEGAGVPTAIARGLGWES